MEASRLKKSSLRCELREVGWEELPLLLPLYREFLVEARERGDVEGIDPARVKEWVDYTKERLKRGSCFVVAAFREGRPLGFVVGEVARSLNYLLPSRVGRVTVIMVDEEVRGKGLGTELLRFAEKRFRSMGLKQVFLDVSACNEEAYDFYKERGYSDYFVTMRKKI